MEDFSNAPYQTLQVKAEECNWVQDAFAYMLCGYYYLPDFPLDVEAHLMKLGEAMPASNFGEWHDDIPMATKNEAEKAKMFPISALASPGESLEFDNIIAAIGGDESPYDGDKADSKEDTAQKLTSALSVVLTAVELAAHNSCHQLYTAILLAVGRAIRSHRNTLHKQSWTSTTDVEDVDSDRSPPQDTAMDGSEEEAGAC
jgi:hypothetical protein